MAKTNAQLTAEVKKLTEANEKLIKDAEVAKAANKKKRQEKAEAQKKGIKAKLDAELHHWVQVFNVGLDDGVDFNFNYEGVPFKLYSGKPVFMAESVIKHLKRLGHPIITEKQGEAGQAVVVHGFHHNFNVQNCEEPKKTAVA